MANGRKRQGEKDTIEQEGRREDEEERSQEEEKRERGKKDEQEKVEHRQKNYLDNKKSRQRKTDEPLCITGRVE